MIQRSRMEGEALDVSMIGSGSLALGLLYPWLVRLPGARLSILTRGRSGETKALRANRQYRLRLPSHESIIHLPEGVLLYNPDNLEARPAQRCVLRLEKSDVAAVSVGVGQFRRVGRLIARACLREDAPPLHLLAFENVGGASTALKSAVEEEMDRLGAGSRRRELVAHAAIPDRACKRKLDQGQLVVEAEHFGELLLEDSARSLFPEVLDPVSPLPSVRHLPPEDLGLGEKRKFWLVNGTHTALGVLCARSNRQRLLDGLADSRIEAILRLLHGEWVRILLELARTSRARAGVLSADELEAHAAKMFDRLLELPHWTVRDVLRELTAIEEAAQAAPTLQRLLQKLDDRLAEAVRVASDAGGVPVPVSGWVLAAGIAMARRYSDTYLN